MRTVCFFGIYDPEYSRNRVLRRGFLENGFDVVDCRVDPRRFTGFRKYLRLLETYRKLENKRFDHVIVAFPGQTVVWLARMLFGKRIILDAFVSLYDSNVNDRALYSGRSLKGMRDYMLDFWACRMADVVLLDTQAHISFFCAKFRLPASKFRRVIVGTDDQIFHPTASLKPVTDASLETRPFLIHFHGRFIPLQGIEHILDAASILNSENIRFQIIGTGQLHAEMMRRAAEMSLRNIRFIPDIPLADLPAYIAPADACLGIFGSTEKASRVIPNKVFECIAMGKAVITRDSPAIREVFTDSKNIVLCTASSGQAIAQAIREIRDDAPRRASIAENAAGLSRSLFIPRGIVRRLIDQL